MYHFEDLRLRWDDINKTGNVRVTLTLIHLRVTTVAVQQPKVLHILSVCLKYLFIQDAKRMHRTVIRKLYGPTTFLHTIS